MYNTITETYLVTLQLKNKTMQHVCILYDDENNILTATHPAYGELPVIFATKEDARHYQKKTQLTDKPLLLREIDRFVLHTNMLLITKKRYKQ